MGGFGRRKIVILFLFPATVAVSGLLFHVVVLNVDSYLVETSIGGNG